MNLENEHSNSRKKIIKRNMNYTKLSIKRNLKIMDDPAFHFNRTVKEYINNRLSNNNSNINIKNLREIKISNEISNIFPKRKDRNFSYNKGKTLLNISNNKQFFSKKKLNKIKKSNTKKKLIKSNSNNIFNLGNYVHINNNKNINVNNKKNKNKLMKKKLNNSAQKFFRYSGSTAFSNNDTNQVLEKTNSISPYNNQLLSNHSTLDLNNMKVHIGRTTIKKYKFNSKFFTQKSKDKKNYSNTIKIKNKNKIFKNFNLDKNIKNFRVKDTKINNKVVDDIRNIKIINDNNKNLENNINTVNKEQNNSNFKTDVYKDNNEISNNNNYNDKSSSFSILNNKNEINSPKKNIKVINVEKGNNSTNINVNLNEKIENNNIQKNDNDIKYLKRIEILENENKALKGEIDASKNKLIFLENKINELLIRKNSKEKEKEESLLPTQYIKKYSIKTLKNFHPSPSNIINDKDIYMKKKEKKIKIKRKKEKNNSKILLKNHSFLNKIKKYKYNPSRNNNQNKKLNSLDRNKSCQILKNNNSKIKINVNKTLQNKNEKNKIFIKKKNYSEDIIKKFNSNYLNFFTEGNIKK